MREGVHFVVTLGGTRHAITPRGKVRDTLVISRQRGASFERSRVARGTRRSARGPGAIITRLALSPNRCKTDVR